MECAVIQSRFVLNGIFLQSFLGLCCVVLNGCTANAIVSTTPPEIIEQPANQTNIYGQTSTFSVKATGSSPLSYQWYVGDSAIQGANGSSYTSPATTPTGTQSFMVVVKNRMGSASSQKATLTVTPATPMLSFAAISAKTYGDAAFTVSASSASSGAVTYSVLSGPATISGKTVTLTGAGTVILQATQAATTNYAAATATTSFTVSAATPTLSFAAISAKTYGDAAFTVSASSASSGAVTYSVLSGPATISGNTVTLTGAGTVILQATQAATTNYTAATATTSVSVYGAPSIGTQPASTKACKGSNVTMSVTAQNGSSYLWYTQSGSYVGSGATLVLANVTGANSGGYYVVVSNAAGASVTSSIAYLTVLGATDPVIKTNPESITVYATQTATFSVLVSATDTMAYQWYKNGAQISDATAKTYTTGSLTAADSGSTFYVVVNDSTCSATPLTSSAATLTVSTVDTAVPPTIIEQPQGQIVSVGSTAEYTVVAAGSGTLSYQWYRVPYSTTQATTAGTSISGATGTMYTTGSVAQSNDGDEYFVRVKNAYGVAVSDRALLTVGKGISLQITGQPQSVTVSEDTEADFSVTATCNGCTPAYQWYWYAPGSSTATALSDGAMTSGTLSGAVVAGSNTAALSIQNTPGTAAGSVFYVVVTSTSDGSTQISGTHAITSNQAGLFVGSTSTVGNGSNGGGLCNGTSTKWVLNGSNPGYTSSNIPYQNLSSCTVQMTKNSSGTTGGYAAIFWPTLIPTDNFTVKLTVTMASSSTPADGFTLILADPTQGATTSSLGSGGFGMGAAGIPGLVLGFDTYYDYGVDNTASGVSDPMAVPYMAIGQGAAKLWENPWTNVNGYLNTQSSSDYTPYVFANSAHAYVMKCVNGVMTVTMDGYELFTGKVALPSSAYLGFTASTGLYTESVVLSNMSVAVGTN